MENDQNYSALCCEWKLYTTIRTYTHMHEQFLKLYAMTNYDALQTLQTTGTYKN